MYCKIKVNFHIDTLVVWFETVQEAVLLFQSTVRYMFVLMASILYGFTIGSARQTCDHIKNIGNLFGTQSPM